MHGVSERKDSGVQGRGRGSLLGHVNAGDASGTASLRQRLVAVTGRRGKATGPAVRKVTDE